MVNDFIMPFFMQGVADAVTYFAYYLIPRDTFPLAAASCTVSFQWVKNPVSIFDLVDRCGALGAIPTAAAGVIRIAFKLPHFHRFFIDITNQSAGRFAVKASGGNDGIIFLFANRPSVRIVFKPIVPLLHGWKTLEVDRLHFLRAVGQVLIIQFRDDFQTGGNTFNQTAFWLSHYFGTQIVGQRPELLCVDEIN